MSSGSINNLSSSYLQQILSSTLQKAGLNTNQSNSGLSSVDSSSLNLQTDNGQLSPFAQLMSTLQQLQQSDPSKYQQVTQQISTNLQTAAQTAQSEGKTTAANILNQLSTDFSNASSSGQLPNVQDLARAVGGHHHHHHAQGASSDTSGSSSDSDSGSTTNPLLSQFLAAFQTGQAQNDALNPMSIIMNTLSTAGIDGSGS